MTENSPYPDELKAMHAALAKAQGEMPAIPKNKKVDTGKFQYEYADLGSILSLVRPVLAENGLALVQRLENPSGGGPSIRTELRHADGGVIAASFPLGEWSTPQMLGSQISYVRRYAVSSMLALAAEDDDDGASAGSLRASAGEGAAVASRSPTAAPLKPDTTVSETPFKVPVLEEGKYAEEDLTSAQRRKIFAVRTKLIDAGLFTEEDFKAQLVMSFGVDSVSGLTKEQASDLIGRLLAKEEELV